MSFDQPSVAVALYVAEPPASKHLYFIYPRLVKRGFDLALALVSALLWAPLVVVLALFVRMDGGPAFYSQPRLGRNGRVFRLWKLRTMVPNAEEALRNYLAQNPAAKAEWDYHQKLRHDPRVTRIGRILRKYSLDELPQLYNVLIGEMSVVGPRPMCVDQRSQYAGTAYFDMRPGLTGFWQISDRHTSGFADRAGYDNRYARQMSLVTDIKIMLMTPHVLFRGTGC